MLPDILRRLSTTGLRRGLAGSRPWIVVGIIAAGIRILQHLARDGDAVLYRTAIQPGDVFEIVTRRPSPKK
jgi:hypothetical protein